MITARYDRQALRVQLSGHARSGEPGRDLVCAAATMLACTLAANIERLCALLPESQSERTLTPGQAVLSLTPPPGTRGLAAPVFESIWLGLALLARSHPQAVRCVEEPENQQEGQ